MNTAPGGENSHQRSQASIEPPPNTIDLTIIRENYDKVNLVVRADLCILDILSMVVPRRERQFVLESFGKVHKHRTSLSSVVEHTHSTVLLLSSIERPYPVARDEVTGFEANRVLQRANEIVKLHWEFFHHSTTNLLGYCASRALNPRLPLPSEETQSQPSSSDIYPHHLAPPSLNHPA